MLGAVAGASVAGAGWLLTPPHNIVKTAPRIKAAKSPIIESPKPLPIKVGMDRTEAKLTELA